MFLTRLPIPKWVKHRNEYLQLAPQYFTLVGIVIGAIVGTTYCVSNYIFTSTIAIVISIIVGIFTTGAFHEDGFADVCDSFGGGWDKEKILTIMKDSRLGTYGTVGLVLILLFKFLLLQQLATTPHLLQYKVIQIPAAFILPILLITAHSLSRFMPLIVIQYYTYIYQTDVSKSKPMASQKMRFTSLLFAALIGCVGFLMLPIIYSISIAPMVITTLLLANYFKKWIGGYTGDCLGTVQQVSEIVFYLVILML